MSLLIKGMAIPKDSNLANMILLRDGDGQWCVGIRDSVRDIKDIQWYEVVEIKVPHGRLIDADELNLYDISPTYGMCVIGVTEEDLVLAESVIEAERETNEDEPTEPLFNAENVRDYLRKNPPKEGGNNA